MFFVKVESNEQISAGSGGPSTQRNKVERLFGELPNGWQPMQTQVVDANEKTSISTENNYVLAAGTQVISAAAVLWKKGLQ